MPDSIELLRKELASIDLSNIKEEEVSESEHKEYVAAISAVFPRLEKDIKRFLHEQLMFIANQATDMNQISFGRGTFNGMDLLLNHWRKAFNEQNAKEPKEDFDKNNPVGEL